MTYMLNALTVQLQLPVKGFILDDPHNGVLDISLLGDDTQSANNLFILDQSKLDTQYLGESTDDPNSAWTSITDDIQEIVNEFGADATATGWATQPMSTKVTLLGSNWDPRRNNLVSRGRGIRAVTAGGTAVFTGFIRNVVVDRPKPAPGRPGKVRVVLYVTDSVAVLAGVNQNGAQAGTFANRVDTLASNAGVQYNRRGSGTTALAKTDFNDNLVNHLELATDSEGGYWFCDRTGAIQVVGADAAATDQPLALFAGNKFADPTYLYYYDIDDEADSALVLNQLQVKNLTWGTDSDGNPAGVETDYAFEQITSEVTYGAVSGDMTLNLANTSDVTARATALLQRRSVPTVGVSAVYWNATKNTERAAQFQPYQIVMVQYRDPEGYFEDSFKYRIMSVKETITATQWLTTLTLDQIGG